MNTTEVLNTPGYYYAIAYAMSEFVIAGSNEKKLCFIRTCDHVYE